MSKEEVIAMIKRNGHSKTVAIEYIMGFLVMSRPDAKKFYERNIENV